MIHKMCALKDYSQFNLLRDITVIKKLTAFSLLCNKGFVYYLFCISLLYSICVMCLHTCIISCATVTTDSVF